LFRESLRLCRQHRLQRFAAWPLVGLALALDAMGAPPEQIARLMGAADALHQATGLGLGYGLAESYERTRAAIRGQLGEAAWVAAWEAGQRLSLEQDLTLEAQA
jgi:hypothetical protein